MIYYTGSLAPADFSGAFFTHTHLPKNSPNVQLMQFLLQKGKNSFPHVFWVTNDLSAAGLGPGDFCPTEKNAIAKDLGPGVFYFYWALNSKSVGTL